MFTRAFFVLLFTLNGPVFADPAGSCGVFLFPKTPPNQPGPILPDEAPDPMQPTQNPPPIYPPVPEPSPRMAPHPLI